VKKLSILFGKKITTEINKEINTKNTEINLPCIKISYLILAKLFVSKIGSNFK